MMTYQLYNEDCLEAMKRIPDGSVDMVMADFTVAYHKINGIMTAK
jgi:hypothetical protein